MKLKYPDFLKLFLLFSFFFNLNIPAFSETKEDIGKLQDEVDIQGVELKRLSEEAEQLKNTFNFRFFGSIAVRHCYMTEDLLTQPQNFLSNTQGNMLQTRITAGVNGSIVDNFNYQLRVLSIGENSWNLPWLPVSTNIIRIPVYFDRYFIGYHNNLTPDNLLKIAAGRSPNFFPETELLYDEDVSFTGLTQQYIFNSGNNMVKEVSLSLAENLLANEGTYHQVSMLGAKAAVELEPAAATRVRTGISYITYPGVDALAKYQFIQGYTGKVSRRNQVNDSSNGFISDFNILNAFIKLAFNLFNLPLELVVDYVHNLGAIAKNKGFLIGAGVGKLDSPGDWKLNYNFKSLGQDYHLSFFVQDQMGGTDVQGNELSFHIKAAQKTTVFFQLQQRHNISSPAISDLFILYSNIRQDF